MCQQCARSGPNQRWWTEDVRATVLHIKNRRRSSNGLWEFKKGQEEKGDNLIRYAVDSLLPSLLICPHYEAACCIERMMSFNYVLFAKFIITECTVLRQMTYKNITKLLPFLFFATF